MALNLMDEPVPMELDLAPLEASRPALPTTMAHAKDIPANNEVFARELEKLSLLPTKPVSERNKMVPVCEVLIHSHLPNVRTANYPAKCITMPRKEIIELPCG